MADGDTIKKEMLLGKWGFKVFHNLKSDFEVGKTKSSLEKSVCQI